MMKRKLLSLLLLFTFGGSQAYADEGMWLMQQLSGKYKELQARGLKLAQYDVYNPEGTSLQDAVVIFDRGCTGEIISSQGLVLTNHHCGFDAIQSLSSVQHNYLEDGYWAQSFAEELPAKGVTITFIDKIEDVTDYVKKHLSKIKDPNSMDYLSAKYLATLATKRAGKLPKGVEVEIKHFYNGNRYLMFTKKIYSDIRLVGTPPSSIGKFGADTDNWAYPRHSGDFSIFRIYADAHGNPVDYSPANVPLRPKRWFNISTKGVQRGDFAMIMGFPGRTYRFFLPSEVQEWKSIDNDIRIRMRGIRQEVMLGEMHADPAINIKYAAKYASSQNGYKRAIGANWGVEVRHLDQDKRQQMDELLTWADKQSKPQYRKAVETIDETIKQRAELRRRLWYLEEGLLRGIDLIDLYKQTESILKPQSPRKRGEQPDYTKAREQINHIYKQEFDLEVDRKIATALIAEYCKQIPAEHRPEALRPVGKEISLEEFVEAVYQGWKSYLSALDLGAQMAATGSQGMPSNIQGSQDGNMRSFVTSVLEEHKRLKAELAKFDNPIDLARRTYVEGMLSLHGEDKLWPDANSTLRFTFGNIKGYRPKDGVVYTPKTYLDGVMQKEDPTSWEFAVAPRLKEIYTRQTYGKGNRWAERQTDGSWRMPVNMCATTHTTGGNSGSPVFDGSGNLIGINFDRNWEGVGGDIQYLADYQRSIICDIRYILMIIEEYGQCHRLLEEMTFAS